MRKSHSDRVQNAHNKGQSDASSGSGYSKPHGLLDELTADVSDRLSGTDSLSERQGEINSAYRQGYSNAKR